MKFQLCTDFSKGEFCCPCCGEMQLKHQVIFAIQALRNLLGFPLQVTSGYRCHKYNAKKGSNSTSQHPQGLALDIEFRTDLQLYLIVRHAPNFGFNGIGIYYDRGFVHLDMRPEPGFWSEHE